MNGDVDNGSRVSFSVKELLVEISRDIKELRTDINTKADATVVSVLATQVNNIDKRLITVETQEKQKMRLEDLWFPIIASTIVGLVIGAASVFSAIKGFGL